MNEVWMWSATDNIREDGHENDYTGTCEICGEGLDGEELAEVVYPNGDHAITHAQCYLDHKQAEGLRLA